MLVVQQEFLQALKLLTEYETWNNNKFAESRLSWYMWHLYNNFKGQAGTNSYMTECPLDFRNAVNGTSFLAEPTWY
jgi:hypothetical protein